MKQDNLHNLIYRRQYLLSNNEVTVSKDWKKSILHKIKTPFTLFVHPDLDILQAENDEFEIILLGYILDPHHAAESSADILRNLIKAKDFNDIITRTFTLSGRFVIIYNDAESVNVFNDAIGLREVYYTNNNNIIACGSTPDIIAEYHSIQKDNSQEINDFFSSPEFNRNDRIWLGTGTIFKNVHHLLPNHYLKLLENKVVRFWPVEKRQTLNINDAANRMANILTGSFDSLVNRHFDLQQSLTSGWDTRLLLATCRKHIDKIHFYFNRGFKSDYGASTSIDYETALKITRDYNLDLEIVDIHTEIVESEFEELYYRNNILARPICLKVFFDRHKKGLDNTVNVSGTSGNEILRVVNLTNRRVKNSHQLAKLFGYQKYEYILNELQQWLDDSRHLTGLNYSLFDLFFWEQLIGNWGALGASEQDIVREEFRPFNNRELISIYTSLKDNQRYTDNPDGHVYVIRLLWKELLDYPMDISQYKFKKLLRTVGLEQFLNILYHRAKKVLK